MATKLFIITTIIFLIVVVLGNPFKKEEVSRKLFALMMMYPMVQGICAIMYDTFDVQNFWVSSLVFIASAIQVLFSAACILADADCIRGMNFKQKIYFCLLLVNGFMGCCLVLGGFS